MDSLKKIAVVTGGTKGIGLGVVEMLVDKGYEVIASYSNDEIHAKKVSKKIKNVKFIKSDHSKRKNTYGFIDFIKKQTKNIDCVVCNSAQTIRKSFIETSDIEWDSMFEVGLNSHFLLLRELYPIMSRKARVIFTGSAMAQWPHATVVGYGVVKESVHSLVKNLVKVFEEKQITVNAVAPGFVDTDWHKCKSKFMRNKICENTAIHRFANVKEIIQAYEFCIENEFVNGSIIEINGGYNYK